MLGNSSVGKTAILRRYCYGKFDENTDTTVAIEYGNTTYERDGEKIKIKIVDTAG